MEYWKMNGAGNDFICIDNTEGIIDSANYPELARTLCDREKSIGADGMMIVERSEAADFKMLFFNCDGSIGEMCGNGARCLCRYGYEKGFSGDTQSVETSAGIITGERLSEDIYRIKLNRPENLRMNEVLNISGKDYTYSYVELGHPGIPHAVVEIKGLSAMNREELFDLGKKLCHSSVFYKGANVNFYEQTGDNSICLATFERGVEGFTDACGTGSASTVFILALNGKVSGSAIKVDSKGGSLTVDVINGGKDIFLSGPTEIEKTGKIGNNIPA